jgi:hypothetical protein
LSLLLAVSCLEERPRPGPPQLTFTLDRTTVRAAPPPDTVAGTVRAEDPDGIDSVWIAVDSVSAGEDGAFDRVFTSRFRFLVGSGKSPGAQVPVVLRARDIAGFEVSRDTFVVVVP